MQTGLLGARFRRLEGARPWVLGHRGARHAAPENTLLAFELSRQEGAEGVELDVRLDGEGRVVVLHDRTLERVTCGRSTELAERLSTRALRALDVGQGERVPLLSEVLEWSRTHDQLVNVEVKSDLAGKRSLLEAIARELTDARESGELVLLSSFHPGFVRALAARLPSIAVCWLVHEESRLHHLAPAFRLLGASGVNPEHSLISRAIVARLKRSQAVIGTWTVNDGALARAYAALGVDVIISDRPGAIVQALSSHS